ncbi:hypothetical protein TSUD_66740 [Trifolium subterraneum]|uniref:Uncharacterized protein n=1 Tax=Trifolium subterraneum TaxID=3900 RepID=A0A2Z6NV04_TRISU|nr:hypothetical protein TSUD_66740 [Trifolium subterraneum]
MKKKEKTVSDGDGEDSNLLTKVEGEIDWIIVGVGGRFVVCISDNVLGDIVKRRIGPLYYWYCCCTARVPSGRLVKKGQLW